ncbi:unnamed protein product [Lymnaea stagnalis]|uniref:Uncharacterized protein n=1 Tax=Lymnaea stagnalis TaxID=6523 RepID=A0AAV2HGF1_LYMST
MRKIVLLLLIFLNLVVRGQCYCTMDNWVLSFDQEGSSKCSNSQTYIRGFERSENTADDGIGLLEYAQCCSAPDRYEAYEPKTQTVDWILILDNNNQWAKCPDGYFLQGLYRSGSWPGYLYNIEQGLCAKPFRHPDNYGSCYDQDIVYCFDDEGLCNCQDGYYVTGIYRGGCNKLLCIETLKCCSMA